MAKSTAKAADAGAKAKAPKAARAPKAAKPASGGAQIRLTLLKSRFGRTPGHAECLSGLGLRHRHQTVVVTGTPENRGMIDKVRYMLKVEEA